MKATILSDLHLDFWIRPGRTKIAGTLEQVLNNTLHSEEDVEVLIVAGDITHYPAQVSLLEDIAKKWNYKKVICVLGNHELYLVSKKQQDRCKNSIEKQKMYYNYKSDIVKILDGEVYEYKGVKFGGAMSWYDGSYLQTPNMYGVSIVQEWKSCMNDSRLIKGYADFYDIMIQEIPKIERILDVDVVITHVCPLTESIAFQEEYRYKQSSKFYAFNGEKYLKKARAKYWIHGHQHFTRRNLIIHDTELCINALGYPGEKTQEKMLIEI